MFPFKNLNHILRFFSVQHQVPEIPVTPRTSGDISLVAVACLLSTMYLVANIMAVKLISVAGLTFFDAGTITFPLAFMLGDVLTEIWGYKTARKIIFLAFFSMCCWCA